MVSLTLRVKDVTLRLNHGHSRPRKLHLTNKFSGNYCPVASEKDKKEVRFDDASC